MFKRNSLLLFILYPFFVNTDSIHLQTKTLFFYFGWSHITCTHVIISSLLILEILLPLVATRLLVFCLAVYYVNREHSRCYLKEVLCTEKSTQ
jgi:hypothetical protein